MENEHENKAVELTLDEKTTFINNIAERLRTKNDVTEEELGETTRMIREVRAEMASGKGKKKAPTKALGVADFT